MLKLLQFRSIKPHHFTRISTFASLSETPSENSAISCEAIPFINSVHSVGALREVAYYLNREVVVSIIQDQARLKEDPRICFRLFIWAADVARCRSGVSQNLIIDMLVSCRERNSFELYWAVVDEFRNEGLPVPADAFAVLILSYWRLGKAEKAVETFQRMKDYDCKPNLAAYNVILNVLVKKGVILLALAIYNKLMKLNLSLGCDTYGVLIDGLYKSGMTDEGHDLFKEMIQRGILPNKFTYTLAVAGLCKEKKMNGALSLFNLMKSNGLMPDSVACNALLNGFCKYGQIDEAKMLFDSFRSDGHAHTIGIRGFSTMIDGLLRAKRYSEAEGLFKEVLEMGLEPDIILYTIMMRGLCEAGRMEDAANQLRDMIRKSVEPDTQCYNVFIKGFVDIGLPTRALSLKLEAGSKREATNMLREIIGNVLIKRFCDIVQARFLKRYKSQHNQFPDTHTYTILIHSLCRHGLIEAAQQIFNDMEEQGCFPSAVTFNALIDGRCKSGNLKKAKLMFCKMGTLKNPSLFIHFLEGGGLKKKVENWVESWQILKAYKIFMQLPDSGVLPDIHTYNTLINGMCKNGDLDGALKLLDVKEPKPNSVTYATLIDGLHNVGRDNEADKLVDQMTKTVSELTPSVYKTLMTWSCRRGKISLAFTRWLKYLRSLSGRDDRTLTLSEKYLQEGDLEKSLKNLLEMDIKSADFDPSPYNIWLVGLCQANKVDEALKTFSMLEEFNVLVSAPSCVNLIRSLISERQLTKAVDVFGYTMEKGYVLMPGICNCLLKALLDSNDTATLAFELCDRIISFGYDLNSHLYRSTKLLLNRYLGVREDRRLRLCRLKTKSPKEERERG